MDLYKHIIVPLDGSELSAQALPAARLMAQSTGSTMTLVRSFMALPQWQIDSKHGRYSGSLALDEHARLSALLTAEKQRLEKMGMDTPIEVEVHEGAAVEVITNLATRHPHALIVMSTHGRGGMSRLVMGSVTSRVVGLVKNPTMVMRCEGVDRAVVGDSIDNIVVPLDGSEFAEMALPHAAEMARLFGARITLCQSTHSTEYFQAHTEWGRLNGEAGFRFGGPGELSSSLAELSVEYLKRHSAELDSRYGISDVWVVNSRGGPADTIVKLACDLDNSMIVMTTHGRSGIGRALLGSVADQVIRRSPAPTLLVRGPVPDGAMDHDRATDLMEAGV
jgi:nucleotide-binding universal stress UspA family protein